MPTRILIVDDHAVVRATIRSLLLWHEFEICGEAKNGRDAIEKAIDLKPDVVLMDINMPVMDGITAAYEIRHISPWIKIVFLTIHDKPARLANGFTLLSHGFVTKSAAGTELIPTLNRLAAI